jgi:hypothetical protein
MGLDRGERLFTVQKVDQGHLCFGKSRTLDAPASRSERTLPFKRQPNPRVLHRRNHGFGLRSARSLWRDQGKVQQARKCCAKSAQART